MKCSEKKSTSLQSLKRVLRWCKRITALLGKWSLSRIDEPVGKSITDTSVNMSQYLEAVV